MVDVSGDDAVKETVLAATFVAKYAGIIIINGLDGGELIPLLTAVQNIYTDPQVPNTVEAKLYAIGDVTDNSPVMFTTNFALTFYTVASDLESAGIDSYLIVVDSEGIAVDCAVAGRKITADKVAEAIREAKVEEKVKHRTLIIPGKAARLSGEIEESSKWEVLVGRRDSSDIPKFLKEKWTTTT